MVKILNVNSFIDNPKRVFTSDDFEFTGKFLRITADSNVTPRTIKVNQPVATKGYYVSNLHVEHDINLGAITPLDEPARQTIQKALLTPGHDFGLVIGPHSDVRLKGKRQLPQGRISRGHYTDKGIPSSQLVFYHQIKDIGLDPQGATHALKRIKVGKPVSLQGKMQLYDHSLNDHKQQTVSYGTYDVKLGTITPQDQLAVTSLKKALARHEFHLIIDQTSTVAFAGKEVPTGIVTNYSQVVLGANASMSKVLISDHAKINLLTRSIQNSVLLGTKLQDTNDLGSSKIVDSIVDARTVNKLGLKPKPIVKDKKQELTKDDASWEL